MLKIMFNDRYGLTDAVLDGRKTMTRRIAHRISENINKLIYCPLEKEGMNELSDGRSLYYDTTGCVHGLYIAGYKVGEEIAIAQKYSECVNDILTNWGHKTDIATLAFKKVDGWDNKMFVRAEHMPHRIRITDIRVERLQDISDDDCLREGIKEESSFPHKKSCPFYFDGGKHGWDNHFSTPREAFAALIDKVSGRGTWESNPYVWVYSFELIK